MSRAKPSSAENGRRSREPTTEEGLERCRLAAFRHGLCTNKIVKLPWEIGAAFDRAFQSHVNLILPQNDIERALVSEMAAASWRWFRALWMEQSLFEQCAELSVSPPHPIHTCLEALDSHRFNLIQIYKSRAERTSLAPSTTSSKYAS